MIDYTMLSSILKRYMQLRGMPAANAPFFDIGCNAGSFVRVLQGYRITEQVHCFEPHPVLSAKTKETFPHITMNEMCVSNRSGPAEINLPMLSCSIGSLIDRPVFKNLPGQVVVKHPVQCITLDEYCAGRGIDWIEFMKIDVEGAEKMVLDGAASLLSARRIGGGVFEVGSTLTDAGTSAEEICALLEGYGYVVDTTADKSNYLFYLPKQQTVT